MATKPYIIALEEHYFDPEVKRHTVGQEPTNAPRIVQRLDDVGELRLREMDEAGIDMQVLSHANPGLQKLDAETAVRLARGANDRLHEKVRAHPDRFAAFAAIPTPDPRDIFCEHFYITTSGFFSDPALLCCMMEIGIDRILFSVDYPFVDNPPGAKWTETLPLSAEDKEKLLNGNAKRLLRL